MNAARFELHVAPQWELVSATRELVQLCVTRALSDERRAGEVGLAVHELMENAVKYSARGEGAIGVAVVVEESGTVRITVENEALPEHVPVLLEVLREIDSAQDPSAYYRRKIEESSTRTDHKSCLGLARIRCETRLRLSCSVDGLHVQVIAIDEPESVYSRL